MSMTSQADQISGHEIEGNTFFLSSLVGRLLTHRIRSLCHW